MGDKPSKSHSDDESLPPHLVRTNLRLDGATSLSFSEASSLDADYHLRSRQLMEFSTCSEIASDETVVNNSNGAATSSLIQSPGNSTSFDPIVNCTSSDKLISPKRSKPTSPVSGHNADSFSVVNSSVDSLGSSMLSSENAHGAADVSVRGHSDDASLCSIEPPSPSTSSTRTVISVIHVQDSVGMPLDFLQFACVV